MTSVFGDGVWRAEILERSTGESIPLEDSGWSANPNRTVNDSSSAVLTLDADYAEFLKRTPRAWLDELILYRDDRFEWGGPFVSKIDAPTEFGDNVIAWEARDRMELVLRRRAWFSSVEIEAPVTQLFQTALMHADFGDPLGLRFDPIDNGVVSSLRAFAGDMISSVVRELSSALQWTVVGNVVRFGRLDIPTGLVVTDDGWASQPQIEQDGMVGVSHIVAITARQGRVFYPSRDQNDRVDGSPLLVDQVFVGDISVNDARRVARQIWQDRQGGLFIDAGRARVITEDFPLNADELVPGAVLGAEVNGLNLVVEDVPVRLSGVQFSIKDSQELSVATALVEAPNLSSDAPVAILDGAPVPEGEVADALASFNIPGFNQPVASSPPRLPFDPFNLEEPTVPPPFECPECPSCEPSGDCEIKLLREIETAPPGATGFVDIEITGSQVYLLANMGGGDVQVWRTRTVDPSSPWTAWSPPFTNTVSHEGQMAYHWVTQQVWTIRGNDLYQGSTLMSALPGGIGLVAAFFWDAAGNRLMLIFDDGVTLTFATVNAANGALFVVGTAAFAFANPSNRDANAFSDVTGGIWFGRAAGTTSASTYHRWDQFGGVTPSVFTSGPLVGVTPDARIVYTPDNSGDLQEAEAIDVLTFEVEPWACTPGTEVPMTLGNFRTPPSITDMGATGGLVLPSFVRSFVTNSPVSVGGGLQIWDVTFPPSDKAVQKAPSPVDGVIYWDPEDLEETRFWTGEGGAIHQLPLIASVQYTSGAVAVTFLHDGTNPGDPVRIIPGPGETVSGLAFLDLAAGEVSLRHDDVSDWVVVS